MLKRVLAVIFFLTVILQSCKKEVEVCYNCYTQKMDTIGTLYPHSIVTYCGISETELITIVNEQADSTSVIRCTKYELY